MAVAPSSYPPDVDAHIWRGFRAIQGELKLGIMMRRTDRAPQWIARLLNLMIAEPAIKLDVVYKLKGMEQPEWLQKVNYSEDSALAEVPIAVKPACCFVDADYEPGSGFTESVRAKMAKRNLDVLLWLDYLSLVGNCSGLAQQGVWQFRLHNPMEPLVYPPYWQEPDESQQLNEIFLIKHVGCFAEGEVIGLHQAPARPEWNLAQNAEQPTWMAAPLLFRALLNTVSDQLPSGKTILLNQQAQPLRKARRWKAETARIRQKLKNRVQQHLTPRWFIGIEENPGSELMLKEKHAFQEVPAPNGSEYSEPFLFDHENQTFLFFKETMRDGAPGRISALEIGENFQLGKPFVVLEENGLGYPIIFRHQGAIYLLAENPSKFTIPLYRAKQFPAQWEHATNLVEGLPLVNTTPFYADNTWYFFTSTEEPGLETLLFYADQLNGTWHYHPRNPICSDCRRARGAGALFHHNGQLIRPAQDCAVRDGYAITLNRITTLSRTEYAEELIQTILPDWQAGLLGTHTWTVSKTYQAIDGLRLER